MEPTHTILESRRDPRRADHTATDVVRYPELDVVRGVAIVAMVIYHVAVIFSWVGTGHGESSRVSLAWLQQPIPVAFIAISGISFSILSRRAAASAHPYRLLARPVIRVGGAAALVSLGSYFVAPDGFVRFGILHLIAVSWLLTIALRRSRAIMALTATAILVAKAILGAPQVWSPWWVWAGFPYPGFASMDYFPLMPWFGVFLLGVLTGDAIYSENGRPSWLRLVGEYSGRGPCRALAFAGRHALATYLAHVPIIYVLARGWAWLLR